MNCEELQGQYELYAMGVAEDPERAEIREHLNRGCEVCMKEMKRARQVASMIGAAAPQVAPSAKLRRRILASVGVEQRSFGSAPWLGLLAALSLVGAFYFEARESTSLHELANVRNQMRQQAVDLTRLNEAMTIINGSDTKQVNFGAGAKGKIFVNPTSGVLLIATNLPPAPAGKAYEMWVIPKGAKPVPAGMFQSQADGTAMHVQPGPVDATGVTIAVTLEDEAGAAQPTSAILFAAQTQ
jgi:anti-sigma-K factor RskA